MQFDLVSERIDIVAVGDHRGDHNQSLERVGYFFLEVKFGQNARLYQQSDQPVDQAGGNRENRDDQYEYEQDNDGPSYWRVLDE